MRKASEILNFGQMYKVNKDIIARYGVVYREVFGLTDKQGEGKMAATGSETVDSRNVKYRTRFNWPPVNVMARNISYPTGDYIYRGYIVTTPDGKEHNIANELFHQLFTKVLPCDKMEFKTIQVMTPTRGLEQSDDDKIPNLTATQKMVDESLSKAHKVWAEETNDFLKNCEVIDAGFESLDERWRPIANAESIEEMSQIHANTKCAFCKLDIIFQPVAYLELFTTRNCNKCELHDKDTTCCWEYQIWLKYLGENDYYNARFAAKALCRRIEDIVRNAGGEI